MPLTSRWIAVISAMLVLACDAGPSVPIHEGTLDVAPGVTLAYHIEGDGPDTLVAVHGGPWFGSGYLRQALRDFVPRRTIIYYDQRGRGQSPALADSLLSMDGDVADLEAVRGRFGLGRMVLLGHHWGAGVAARYALLHPDHVSRLVLVSPMPYSSKQVYEELVAVPRDTVALARLAAARGRGEDKADPVSFCRRYWGFSLSPIEETSPSVVRALGRAICDASGDRLVHADSITRTLYRSLGAWDWTDSLRHIMAPTLVVQGSGEQILITEARGWADSVSAGTLVVTSGPPTFPWLSPSQDFHREIAPFLAAGAVVADGTP